MNKICTDIPQSKKLIELGIDVNTADMYYMYRHWEIDEETTGKQSDASIGLDLDFYYGTDNGKTYHYIPAWSLTALMRLLPSVFTVKGEHSESKYEIDIRKYALSRDADIYQIAYGNYRWHDDGSCSWSDMFNTGQREELIDAAFEMIVWLKKNKKI